MTPQALKKFISEFLITVRKKEHNDKKMNIIHFKLLGCKEHRQMCSRGDVKLFQNFHREGVPRIL